jgi:hypothetical protein
MERATVRGWLEDTRGTMDFLGWGQNGMKFSLCYMQERFYYVGNILIDVK